MKQPQRQTSWYSYSLGNLRLSNLLAMISVKRGLPLVSRFNKLVLSCGGKLSKTYVVISVLLLKQFRWVLQTQGRVGLVLYLKSATILIQQTLSNYKVDQLGPRISRSRTGLPRFLPLFVRQRMLNGDTTLIKFILSVLSLYRSIEYVGELKLSSILKAGVVIPQALILDLTNFIPTFVRMLMRPFRGVDFVSILPAVKAVGIYSSSPQTLGSERYGFLSPFSSHFMTAYTSLFVWNSAKFSQLRQSFIFIMNFYPIPSFLQNFFFAAPASALVSPMFYMPGFQVNKYLGKLGAKVEAAGKIRIFAMVDCWTQWLLRPIHIGIFKLLRRIRMDGTFNQLRPLGLLSKARTLFSLDLTAATDRLPISIQIILMSKLMNSVEFGSHWAFLLIQRAYRVPYLKELRHNVQNLDFKLMNSFIRYSVGQPMGALSSWAMLALTHHLIVQFAAYRVGIVPLGKWFKRYALLGDDIVIASTKVAKAYLRIMSQLGVGVNLSKSIISLNGSGFEFAKRFFVRVNGKMVDVSPISLSELDAALKSVVSMVQFALKYKLSIPTALKIGGRGWKSISWLNKPLHRQSAIIRAFILTFHGLNRSWGLSLSNEVLYNYLLEQWNLLGVKLANYLDLIDKKYYFYHHPLVRKLTLQLKSWTPGDPKEGMYMQELTKFLFSLFNIHHQTFVTPLQDIKTEIHGWFLKLIQLSGSGIDSIGDSWDKLILDLLVLGKNIQGSMIISTNPERRTILSRFTDPALLKIWRWIFPKFNRVASTDPTTGQRAMQPNKDKEGQKPSSS